MRDKEFAERIALELNEIGLPKNEHERTDALSKLLHLPHFKAEALLSGSIKDSETINKLAKELEVSADWLLGKATNRNQAEL